MLLGARQFFERRGAPTPPLPYDAEVEYVGSRNYPDTTLDLDVRIDDDNYVIECDCKISKVYASWLGPYTCYSGETYEATRCLIWDRDLSSGYAGYRRVANSQTKIPYSWQIRTLSRLSHGRIELTPDGGSTVSYHLANPSSLLPDGQQFRLAGGACDIDYYSLRILHSDSVVLDLTPVRTSEGGALFDRVSGRLFGLGRFAVVGPDKS